MYKAEENEVKKSGAMYKAGQKRMGRERVAKRWEKRY